MTDLEAFRQVRFCLAGAPSFEHLDLSAGQRAKIAARGAWLAVGAAAGEAFVPRWNRRRDVGSEAWTSFDEGGSVDIDRVDGFGDGLLAMVVVVKRSTRFQPLTAYVLRSGRPVLH